MTSDVIVSRTLIAESVVCIHNHRATAMPPPNTLDSTLPLHKAVLTSWLSMKTAVMIWLWYLNVLYWVGFYYMPRPEAVWSAIAYLAIGPLIFVMVTRQRGLTRLTGLIHLPWLAFAVYLGLRLFTDLLGTRVSLQRDGVYYIWLQAVFWSTSVCLCLDGIDVIRWLQGERYVLGSTAAIQAGTCKESNGYPSRR